MALLLLHDVIKEGYDLMCVRKMFIITNYTKRVSNIFISTICPKMYLIIYRIVI